MRTSHITSLCQADYSASKAAVINMHEALRYELDSRYNAPKVRTTVLCPGHIHTPLFSTITVPQNAFYQFFVPSLSPLTVVKAIIQALDAHESRTIYLPFYANSSVLMKTFPSFVRDLAQKVGFPDFVATRHSHIIGFSVDESRLYDDEFSQGHRDSRG